MRNKNTVIILIAILIIAATLTVVGFYLVKDRELKQNLSFFNQATDAGNLNSKISSANYAEATEDAKKYQSDYPEEVYGYLVEATAYLQQGSRQFKENHFADMAIDVLNKALLIDPNNSEVYRTLGYAYEIKEDYLRSETSYSKSIQLDPESSLAYSGRGHMYYLSGDEESAYQDIQKALELNPYNAKALLDLSLYHLRNGSDDIDIIEILNSAIAHTEEQEILADAFAAKGSVLHMLEDIKGAEESFEQALVYQPKSVPALLGLSYLYFDFLNTAKSEDEAVGYVNKINNNLEILENLNPNLTNIYVIKAIYYAYVGDPALASDNLEQALSVLEKDITLSKNQKIDARLKIELMLSNI